MSKTHLLPIGELSSATGVSISTIRYYEQRGLVSAFSRVGGKRRFTPDAVGRIGFISRASSVGFSLEDTRRLLDDQANEWPELVASQLDELRHARAELDETIELLEEAQRCGCTAPIACERLEAS